LISFNKNTTARYKIFNTESLENCDFTHQTPTNTTTKAQYTLLVYYSKMKLKTANNQNIAII